jgi:histidinol dehydrogenase
VSNKVGIKLYSSQNLPSDWFLREKADPFASQAVDDSVKEILNRVKQYKDEALLEFALKFDKAKLTSNHLKVSSVEIEEAYKIVTPQQVAALKFMKDRVEKFQTQLFTKTQNQTQNGGITVETSLQPLASVGCYVPGGQAAYPSTLVMTVVPAKVAGVPRIVVVSPSDALGNVNPLVLVAADICKVDEVYKVGGAQAIAALAYGTETIVPVNKIVGPGSKYVTAAKVLVSQDVAIDMPAGPSEVLVIADETADARLIAYDMISQAEHGGDSVAGLITTSEELAAKVQENLSELAAKAQRSEKIMLHWRNSVS